MIEGFNIKDQAIGTGADDAFDFDFKIFDPADVYVYVQDETGAVVRQFAGDDTTYIESLTYDSIDGGGTITLVDDLEEDYVMTMFLAPDLPAQSTSFPNKASFSFDILEGALDMMATFIQRAAYLAQRSVKLHDMDDVESFDPTLPQSLANYPGGIVSVNDDGSGFEIVITTSTIELAAQNAVDAEASEDAAAVSAAAAAASAVAAALSAASAQSGIQIFGTPAAPENVTTAGVAFNTANQEEAHWIQGSGGNVTVTANPQINNGTAMGQRIYLFGANDAQTVTFVNGTGLSLNGDCVLAQDDCLGLIWNGVKWSEMFRRQA